MIDLNTITGRKLALVVWTKDRNGQDEVVIVAGAAEWDGMALWLIRKDGKPPVPIQSDWIPRLREVGEEDKKVLLGAEIALSLSIGSVDA